MCGLIEKMRRGKVRLPRCAFMRTRGAQTEKEGVYLMALKHDAALGYLPEERPPVGKLILYAPVSYTHLDVYKRQAASISAKRTRLSSSSFRLRLRRASSSLFPKRPIGCTPFRFLRIKL